jgi:hypothetical protein
MQTRKEPFDFEFKEMIYYKRRSMAMPLGKCRSSSDRRVITRIGNE